MPAFEIGDVGKYGHICSVYHWKTFQYPNAQSWNVVIFSGTYLDQQMVLWNTSPSECLWCLAMHSAAVVSAAMAASVNRGSHPKSVLLHAHKAQQSPLWCQHCCTKGFILPLGIPAECEPSQLLGWVMGLGCQLHLAQAECPWPGSAAVNLGSV